MYCKASMVQSLLMDRPVLEKHLQCKVTYCTLVMGLDFKI